MFSFLICFQQLLVCRMCEEEGFKFCLDTRNNRALPLDLACPDSFKCLVTSPSTLKATTKCFTVCKDPLVSFFRNVSQEKT
jgi:hypothetical protein